MDLDFQFYDYSENNFPTRYETKTSWTIPSDGSMDSNEEYFWPTPLKLPKQFENEPKYHEESRKRKLYPPNEVCAKKLQESTKPDKNGKHSQ